MKKIIIVLLILFFPFLLSAQRSSELISKENSTLPENDIWSIAVDPLGNKWFGSARSGLIKYNNSELKVYNPQNSIIKGGFIGPLFVDSKGILWVSASDPEELFAIKNDSIEKKSNKFIEDLGSVGTIVENSIGEIYFGGKNGVIKFDGSNWSKIKLPITDVIVRTMAISPNNTIAIGHNSGLIIGTELKWQIFEEEKEKLQLSVVRGLMFTTDTTLIIGYGGGFGNGGFSVKSGEQWTHYNKSNSKILDHTVRDIEVDKKGNYWMATNNGVIKFTSKGMLEPILFRKGMFQNSIMDISLQDDTIWIATTFGVIKLNE